jgi:hypothetical protein
MKRIILGTLAILTASCANPPIVQISPDTYFLSKEDHAGVFGSLAKLKADVVSEANQFAEAQGKVAIPLSLKEKAVGTTPGSWARVDYQFRVVDRNDPEARRTLLTPRPDLVIEQTQKTSGEHYKPKDVYTELMKLDDLRKKGIITDTEFEAQKKKLLNE